MIPGNAELWNCDLISGSLNVRNFVWLMVGIFQSRSVCLRRVALRADDQGESIRLNRQLIEREFNLEPNFDTFPNTQRDAGEGWADRP
jgi:hypothetical protein